jgi:hypothetical protein
VGKPTRDVPRSAEVEVGRRECVLRGIEDFGLGWGRPGVMVVWTMKDSQKIELLRQIRYVLKQEENPTLRAAGLKLHELKEMEKYLDLRIVDDDPVDKMGNYRIYGLSDAGAALLGLTSAATAPVIPTQAQTEKEPPRSRAGWTVGKGILELVKIGMGVVIGWYLKKYYG